ncbi:MAG: nitroreductase family protein [Eubacteriales bacterium]|nr:nitroreductase family protein [Eubacteriales bacterium]
MEFLQLAKERFSCRKFKDMEVEQEKIDKILESAMVAPTAVNKQPQRILVLTDKDRLTALKEFTRFDFDAPLCFVVCADKDKAWTRRYDGKNSAEIDAAIVTTHMMMEAQDLGLGTTWVMSFDPEKGRKALSIPDNLEIVALLPTGYPANDVEINPLHNEFIDEDEMVTYNNF